MLASALTAPALAGPRDEEGKKTAVGLLAEGDRKLERGDRRSDAGAARLLEKLSLL